MVGFPGAIADLGHDDVSAVAEISVRTEHMVTLRRSGLEILQFAQGALVERPVRVVRRRLVVGVLPVFRGSRLPHLREILNGALAEQDLELWLWQVLSHRRCRVLAGSRRASAG